MKDQAMTAPDDRPYVPGQPTTYTPSPAYRVEPAEPAAYELTDDEVLEQFQPIPQQPSRARRWATILIGALAVIAVAVVFSLFTNGSTPSIITPPLVKAQRTCDPSGLGTTVADGKKTLVVNGAGKEDLTGVPVEAEACILRELGATTAVLQHMDSTRALDGRQTDAWGGFKAAWTYHPDNGLDLLIQDS